MKQYTERELRELGYRIENGKIECVDISMADHGCVTLRLPVQGQGCGFVYGGYCLGHGYLGATHFDSSPRGIEYISRIMDTIGVSRFQDMKGKYLRYAYQGVGSPVIKIIGNIIDDKWFDAESFWKDDISDTETD